jgi:hypothetical protein
MGSGLTSEHRERDMYKQNRSGKAQERKEGRRQGQGWYLEDKMNHCLLNQGFWPSTRQQIWGQEVDVVAVRDENLSTEPDHVTDPIPSRIVVSCVDWFSKEKITPCRMWRLIALSYTVGSEPVLVHNHRAQLTSRAQDIAERWRVRVVTDEDLEDGIVLPAPEEPEFSRNPMWPSPLYDDVPMKKMKSPDYYSIHD